MVMAALAFTPEEFDVGVNIFGVTNWLRTLKSIPPWWTSFRDALYAELGDPTTDDSVRLHRISPLFHAGNVTKPLLVLQGANDPRVLQVYLRQTQAQLAAQKTRMRVRIRANWDVPMAHVFRAVSSCETLKLPTGLDVIRASNGR